MLTIRETTPELLNTIAVMPSQILIVRDNGELYYDTSENTRIQIGGGLVDLEALASAINTVKDLVG